MATPSGETTKKPPVIAHAAKAALNGNSVVGVLTAVLFGLLLGYLAQMALSSEFLGSGTRLVHACKSHPNHDPEACGPILEARAPAPTKTSGEFGVGQSSAAFRLAEED